MGLPFTLVQGTILLTDKYGNIIGTRQVAGETDTGGQPLQRMAVDTVIRGSNSPFPTAEVDPTTKALKVILGGNISAGASTTTPLGIGGVYTGAWLDVSNVAYITVLINSNVNSAVDGFELQWSHDGVAVVSDDKYTFQAGNPDPATRQYTFGAVAQYMRVKYTNGSIAQASFVLQTILKIVGTKGSHQRLGNNTSVEVDAELMKAVLAAKTIQNDIRLLNSDNNGNLIVSALTGFNADFKFGDVSTASKTEVRVRRTTYTEQTTNAQRSIASSSANDTAAGTGARTIKITYFTSTGAGPYIVILTLNGTTGVNTGVEDICFIEKMEVVTAGNTGSNVGTLSLYSAINKGGVVVWSIAATDNRTFSAHHYAQDGRVCNITGISCSHNGTTVGSGAVFLMRQTPIGLAGAVAQQVSDFVRLYGQSSTFSRNYPSPIKVTGPAKIEMFVSPESTSAIIYRSAFDFFET